MGFWESGASDKTGEKEYKLSTSDNAVRKKTKLLRITAAANMSKKIFSFFQSCIYNFWCSLCNEWNRPNYCSYYYRTDD